MENLTENNSTEFRQLPNDFKIHGRTMELVERNDVENYAIYKNSDKDSLYYEVFQIKVAKATTMKIKGNAIDVPKRELLPSDNNFGDWAWACSSESAKNRAIEKILKRNANNGKDEEIPEFVAIVTEK